jgi:hypothetical protein
MDIQNLSIRIDYLNYILKEFIKLENSINSFFSERDKKLEVLLNDGLEEAKKDLDNRIHHIRLDFYSIKLENIDVDLLESIAREISECLIYLEYINESLIKKED